MLGKLLKHEFRATSRIMLPVFLVLLILSIMSNISIRVMSSENNVFLNTVSSIILACFVTLIFVACVLSLVLMAQRFHHNLLTDEGYLMFTLPTSVHQLICSKIIVSVVWFAATFVMVCLSGLITAFRVSYLSNFFHSLHLLMEEINAYYTVNGIAIILEFLVLAFLIFAAICLSFYAPMAVGHSFANHKNLLSVVFFFCFQVASQLIVTLSSISVNTNNWHIGEGLAGVHAFLGWGILFFFVYSAIFYIITTFFLKKRLNLE